jgi:hypothetical protein
MRRMSRINFTPLDSKPLSPAGRGQGEGPAPSSAQGKPSSASSKPFGSTLVVDELPNGITVRVPPLGYTHPNCVFPLGLGVVWFVLALAATVAQGRHLGLLGTIGFFVVFASLGLIPLLAGVHLSTRQSAIALVDDRLMILQTGLFGSKRQEWALDDLDAIDVGPSNWRVNNRPLPELQIRPHEGPMFGMLAGHDPRELEWLADALSEQLEPSPEGSAAS